MLQLGWTSSSAGLDLPAHVAMRAGVGLGKQKALKPQVKAKKKKTELTVKKIYKLFI